MIRTYSSIGRQRTFDDLGPQVLAKGADRGAAIPIKRGLVARELLPPPLADDVLAQRGVELLRLAELGPIQRRLGLVEDDVRRRSSKPAIDEDLDGLTRRRRTRFAEDAGQASAEREAGLAARSEPCQ